MAFLVIYTAGYKAGKTQAAVDSLRSGRALLLVPSHENKNADLMKIPWFGFRALVELEDRLQTATLQIHRQLRLVCADKDAELLPFLKSGDFAGYTIVFDDFPTLFYSAKSRRLVEAFLGDIRQKDLKVIITTQRIKGILPRFAQVVAEEIYQVGPLADKAEAQNLYDLGGAGKYEEVSDFRKALKALKQYQQLKVKG